MKIADLDMAGAGRLVVRADGNTLALESKPVPMGGGVLIPRGHASVVADVLKGAGALPASRDAPPWDGGDEPEVKGQFYLGQPQDGGRNDYIRVKRGAAGFILEKGRFDGPTFQVGLIFAIPYDTAKLVTGVMRDAT